MVDVAPPPEDSPRDYDVVVVGSGFGGSVAALRLTEKGYRVAVLEAGRRFADHEFASSWHLRTFLWAPALGCYGIQRIHLLKDSLILAGAGVGGGSLVYANTLYRPLRPFFADPQWSAITDWASELAPHYDQAERMLGVTTNPTTTPADRLMLTVAGQMGCADTFKPAEVGVLFGEPGVTVADPFFGGAGPVRTGCTECGECMTGCRVGAKNTMTKNYLHLAERAGARVVPMTTVTELVPRPGGGWTVVSRGTGPGGRRVRTVWGADQVVVAAGTYGTQTLLHRMRASGRLPRLSARLGELTRTNSEALLGASAPRVDPARDLSRGVAISSSFFTDPTTHIEPVRYGKGSNAMALLQTVLTVGAPGSVRWRAIAGEYARQLRRRPVATVRALVPYRWSERTTIALVMQALDNSLTTSLAEQGPRLSRFLPVRLRRPRGTGRLTSRQGRGEPNPTWIPAGHRVARLMADELDGVPGGSWGDLVNMPMTAHFIGGCPIGATPDDGVLDPYQRVHGYPTLHVLDGAAITANLGVNPSLTITAQAERAVSLWPNAGEADPRPEQGAGYRRLVPVRPRRPVVPRGAPGELR
ncbi:GMC family oxidoreductase [Pengzhenrongella frigida]|uniref:Cholesterol oxidase n=1 Tax=Pengzhenrongella frigida TaxID=1259133 RepID=A0A4V1ZHQ4_9MICO|nr:GMC family oxidoreductase [Cellulomonas sp. HLT2-17]RYV52854.1 GMC family oxidoreductase [Cellulomonas sp. HLT2-17]